jgi:UDP-N-acetylmuramoylalanine-D-glutamate ligase
MELSSFQLMDLTVSPHIAVLQNIYPDHLDYHESFEEYVEAKRNIARFQTPEDYFIYNNDFPLPAQTAELTPGHKLPFSLLDYDSKISTQLLGNHNKYNILPVLKIAEIMKLPKDTVYHSIATFKPLDTRLELVGTKKGIRFFADTLATIPEATIAALEAVGPDVSTLIAGGHERKQDYSTLAGKILNSHIKTLIVFPDTGPRIWQEIIKLDVNPKIKYFHSKSMAEAVKLALKHTPSGKICLLSPAAPSFTLFKDYRDEHEQYKKAIDNL